MHGRSWPARRRRSPSRHAPTLPRPPCGGGKGWGVAPTSEHAPTLGDSDRRTIDGSCFRVPPRAKPPNLKGPARPPTPSRPQVGRPEGRPSIDGLSGAETGPASLRPERVVGRLLEPVGRRLRKHAF